MAKALRLYTHTHTHTHTHTDTLQKDGNYLLDERELYSSKIKNREGITLIALIITIIILLILAGVTIMQLTGSGLFEKTRLAKEQYEIENAREKLILALNEYEIAMRKETLRSIIIQIDGFESIDPDDETGPEYTVVIDGYTFLIDPKLNIEYLGKNDGIVPEAEVSKEIGSEQVTIKVNATTKDEQGLKEIRLLRNGQVVETKTLNSEKQKEETFNVTKNGTYKIVVIGNNSKQKRSEEIQVTELSNITVSLTAGTMIDAQVLLTVSVEVLEGEVKTIELYKGSTKIEEKTYTTTREIIEEEITVDVAFYEEANYYAKVIDSENKEIAKDSITLSNREHIKTETDLKKLAELVNGGTSFQNETLKQVANITLERAHTVIGTPDTPFKGTYDGQEFAVNNIQINNSLQHQGLFGYIESATIKNVTLGTGKILAGNTIGGLVGEANSSTIENVKNNGTTITARSSVQSSWKYKDFWLENIYVWNGQVCRIGGICGLANDTNIAKCDNNIAIQGNSQGDFIGGIVGDYIGNVKSTISECTNSGNITIGGNIGGIIGNGVGIVNIEKCLNTGNITTNNTNVGGIAGNVFLENGYIKNCTNEGNLTADWGIGGIVASSSSENSKVTIDGCKNKGTITATGYFENFELCEGYIVYASELGGIVGIVIETDIKNSSNEGSIVSSSSVETSSIGGIAGAYKNGTIENCYNSKEIKNTKKSSMGGIVGVGYYTTITKCYNKAPITGNTSIAGIIGYGHRLDLRYNYNTGNITGNDCIAGIVGDGETFNESNYNYVYYCYNTGKITANDIYYGYGGIAGYLNRYKIYHTYSLENTCESNIGQANTCEQKGYDLILSSSELTQKVLSNFENNFKADYTDNPVNGGYPILNWQ